MILFEILDDGLRCCDEQVNNLTNSLRVCQGKLTSEGGTYFARTSARPGAAIFSLLLCYPIVRAKCQDLPLLYLPLWSDCMLLMYDCLMLL